MIKGLLEDIRNPEDMVAAKVLRDALMDFWPTKESVWGLGELATWTCEACDRCLWTPHNWVDECFADESYLAKSLWCGFADRDRFFDVATGCGRFDFLADLVDALEARVIKAYLMRHHDDIQRICLPLSGKIHLLMEMDDPNPGRTLSNFLEEFCDNTSSIVKNMTALLDIVDISSTEYRVEIFRMFTMMVNDIDQVGWYMKTWHPVRQSMTLVFGGSVPEELGGLKGVVGLLRFLAELHTE